MKWQYLHYSKLGKTHYVYLNLQSHSKLGKTHYVYLNLQSQTDYANLFGMFTKHMFWYVMFWYVCFGMLYGMFLEFSRNPRSMEQILRDASAKGTLMQIWKSPYMFLFIWKYHPENFAFLILRIFELYTRKVCKMYVYNHIETTEYVEK